MVEFTRPKKPQLTNWKGGSVWLPIRRQWGMVPACGYYDSDWTDADWAPADARPPGKISGLALLSD